MPKKPTPDAETTSAPGHGTTGVRITSELVSTLKIMAAVEQTSIKDIVDRFVRAGVVEWQKERGMKLSIRGRKL